MSIGERICELRKENNLSQSQLAQMLEISRQAVSKWENDQSEPDTFNLILLSDILNTDIEYLASGRCKSPAKSLSTSVYSPVQPQEKIIEKIVEVEKIIEVEKPVVVEKIIEKPVEKQVIKKVVRLRYRTDPIVLAAAWFLGLLVGVLVGYFI